MLRGVGGGTGREGGAIAGDCWWGFLGRLEGIVTGGDWLLVVRIGLVGGASQNSGFFAQGGCWRGPEGGR